MKAMITLGAAAWVLLVLAVPASAQSNQLLQGTELRLVLQNGLSTSVAHEGDPFTAVVAEPVYVGGHLILPAGARVHGQVGKLATPRRFPLLRGQAYMNLTFRSIEVDHREIPAQMSILAIQEASAQSKNRTDVKIEEGQVVEAKTDVKGDITTIGLGVGGGTVVGAIFSHVVRGLGLGLAGGTAYVVAKKGKQVELPAQTPLLVRMDNNVSLPTASARNTPNNSSPQ